MDNQQNNWFRSPQDDMLGSEKSQNDGFVQPEQGKFDVNNCNIPSQNQNAGGYTIPQQNSDVNRTESKTKEKDPKKNTTIIIAALCAVVVALAVAVIVLLSGGDEKKGNVNFPGGGETGEMGEYNVGDYITFGKYEQDNNESNGKDDIEWLVLDKKDGKLLVISKDILSTAMFISNSQYGNNNWAKWDESQIRREMNVEFYNDAFDEDEKKRIAVTKVLPGKNPYYGIDPGGSTEDKLFLLSVDEVLKYFPSESDRKCSMSKYVEECKYSAFAGMWCTRTPGRSNPTAVAVNCNDGSILYEGAYSLNYIGYRPAMWIELSE